MQLEPGATYVMQGGLLTPAVSVGAPTRGDGSMRRPDLSPSLELRGHGAHLLLSTPSGGFFFSGLGGLHVQNLTMDMARQPYTYGRVTSATATSFTLSVDAAAYPFPANQTCVLGVGCCELAFWHWDCVWCVSVCLCVWYVVCVECAGVLVVWRLLPLTAWLRGCVVGRVTGG